MAKHIEDTGIYTRTIWTKPNGADLREWAAGVAGMFDLGGILKDSQAAVEAVLRAHGGELMNVRKLDEIPVGRRLLRCEKGKVWSMPDGKIPPEVREAENVLFHLRNLRDAMKAKDMRGAVLWALKVGAALDALHVRPFERYVRDGRIVKAGRAKGTANANKAKQQEAKEQAKKIRAAYDDRWQRGWTRAEPIRNSICAELQCSRSTVDRALRGHKKKHASRT